MRIGVGLAVGQLRGRGAEAAPFDPLNPPGGPPVAAWLASSLPVGEAHDFWQSSVGNIAFPPMDGGDDVPECILVGGKKRLRCPYSGSGTGVVSQAKFFFEEDPPTPFTVPSGACSIVLVSASLSAGVGGIVLSNGDEPIGGIPTRISPGTDDAAFCVNYKVGALPVADTDAHVWAFQKAGTGFWSAYLDGSDVTWDDGGGLPTADWGNLWIGGNGLYPNDDIIAILIFDRVLSPTERSSYTTWGIAEAGS